MGTFEANAQEIVFNLSLNKQDSTITYKVVNHTTSELYVIRSITRYMPEEMKGSCCYILYKDKKGERHLDFFSVAKKSFDLNPEDTFSIDINISQYMKYQIISIEGRLCASYHLLGEFEKRRLVERRTIKF